MSAVATPVDEVPDVSTLRVADRCDRCGVQAFVRVRITGGVLDFCARDYRLNEPGLAAAGAVVLVDERHRLAAKPTV